MPKSAAPWSATANGVAAGIPNGYPGVGGALAMREAIIQAPTRTMPARVYTPSKRMTRASDTMPQIRAPEPSIAVAIRLKISARRSRTASPATVHDFSIRRLSAGRELATFSWWTPGTKVVVI